VPHASEQPITQLASSLTRCLPLLQLPSSTNPTALLLRQQLCMRRQFMRTQPFFWLPRGRAFRWRMFELFVSLSACTAILTFISCVWLLHAHAEHPVATEGPLGQLTLTQLWAARLPAAALLLRAAQAATRMVFQVVNLVRRWTPSSALSYSCLLT
jgi:hypothetical protein